MKVGRNAFNGREAVCEFVAECLPEKIAELQRGKYCGENSTGNIRGGKQFFNGQFAKIQAMKSSLQQRFTPIAGLALAILSSWRIIWWKQFYLSNKIRSFVLVSVRSSNWCKPRHVTSNIKQQMAIKKAFKNSFYSIPIIIISNIIYLIYSSKFPGGIAGMAPFILVLNSIISFFISLLIFLIISLKFESNQVKSILIFTSVSFMILYFYFGANPFNYSIEKTYRNLDLWLYISILIPTLMMLAIKKIFGED